jgi:plastocyanin
MTRAQRIILVLLVPIVVVGGLLIGRALRPGDDSDSVGIGDADDVVSFEYEYYIPAGTAERIEGGEQVDIVPRELSVRVGESIRIVNDDDEGHVVGVFYVGAGETLTKQFTAPGELSGSCTVHSAGEFTLRVEA